MVDKKVPELRFEGFDGDWEQRELGELGEVTTGKAFSSTDFDNQGEYLVITNKDISDSSKSQNVVTNRINISDNETIQRYNLSGKNILVTMDGVNLGKSAIFSNSKALLAQRVGRIKSNQLEFIYQITSSNTFLSKMRMLSVGNAIKHISLKQISDFSSLVPKDTTEQQKIGNFFKQLDDTIALHQQKLDQLKRLKQGFLQILFGNKEQAPKVRFAGFDEEWEQRKLGEVVQITMGQSPNSEYYTENPLDHILVQGNADMKNNRVVPRVWTTQVTKQAEKGDLILSVRAPVGDIGITDYDVVLGRGVAAIKGNDFIFQQLVKMKKEGFWNRFSTGSTFESINSNDIKEALITIPNGDEQKSIGSFFANLDTTIALHQTKLEKLKQLKKGFLQSMFI
ncbi:restriction endonuclease subunit S [Enterococcus sp. DIV0197]|uniref:restriction endonuclease subunit S n=1 Tax=unclassified Enterococcus TaxID=2608891 RepID=UPI003D299501